LLHAFFKNLEGLDGQVWSGAVVVIQNADEHVNEIDADANAALLRGFVIGIAITIVFINGLRRTGVFWRRAGGTGRGGLGFWFSRPRRTVGAVLRDRAGGHK
jgi:hypothetical protein